MAKKNKLILGVSITLLFVFLILYFFNPLAKKNSALLYLPKNAMITLLSGDNSGSFLDSITQSKLFKEIITQDFLGLDTAIFQLNNKKINKKYNNFINKPGNFLTIDHINFQEITYAMGISCNKIQAIEINNFIKSYFRDSQAILTLNQNYKDYQYKSIVDKKSRKNLISYGFEDGVLLISDRGSTLENLIDNKNLTIQNLNDSNLLIISNSLTEFFGIKSSKYKKTFRIDKNLSLVEVAQSKQENQPLNKKIINYLPNSIISFNAQNLDSIQFVAINNFTNLPYKGTLLMNYDAKQLKSGRKLNFYNYTITELVTQNPNDSLYWVDNNEYIAIIEGINSVKSYIIDYQSNNLATHNNQFVEFLSGANPSLYYSFDSKLVDENFLKRYELLSSFFTNFNISKSGITFNNSNSTSINTKDFNKVLILNTPNSPNQILAYNNSNQEIRYFIKSTNALDVYNLQGNNIIHMPLDSYPISNIYSFNYGLSNTSYYLFTNKNNIFIINDLGNNLPGYPKNVGDLIVGDIVIDSSKNKFNYYIATLEGNLYGYNISGEPLSNFNPFRIGLKITNGLNSEIIDNHKFIWLGVEDSLFYAIDINSPNKYNKARLNNKNFINIQFSKASNIKNSGLFAFSKSKGLQYSNFSENAKPLFFAKANQAVGYFYQQTLSKDFHTLVYDNGDFRILDSRGTEVSIVSNKSEIININKIEFKEKVYYIGQSRNKTIRLWDVKGKKLAKLEVNTNKYFTFVNENHNRLQIITILQNTINIYEKNL